MTGLWRRILGRERMPDPARRAQVAADGVEASQANMQAKDALAHTKAQREEVASVVSSLKRLRQENHFGAAIEKAMLRKENPPS